MTGMRHCLGDSAGPVIKAGMTKGSEPRIPLGLVLGALLGELGVVGGPERRAFLGRAIAPVLLVAPAPVFVAGKAGRRREVGPPALFFLVPPAARIGLVVVVEVDTIGAVIPGDTNFTNFVTFRLGLPHLDHRLGHHLLVSGAKRGEHQVPVGIVCSPAKMSATSTV